MSFVDVIFLFSYVILNGLKSMHFFWDVIKEFISRYMVQHYGLNILLSTLKLF